MHIEFIESFLTAAECGSLAKAGERLRLSHPAIGKQIRSLEAYYGVSLLRRTSAGVELTEAGARLRERVGPLYAQWQAIRRELRDASAPRAVRLGILPSLAARYLPSRMRLAESLGLKPEPVVEPTSRELHDRLRTGSVDAVLGEPPPAGLTAWSAALFEEPLVLVAHRSHPLAAEPIVRIARLRDEPLVLHPAGCGIRRRIAELCRERGFEPDVGVEAGFGDFLLGYVAAGSGLTVVPKTVADALPSAELAAVPFAEPAASRMIALTATSRELGRALLPVLRAEPAAAGDSRLSNL